MKKTLWFFYFLNGLIETLLESVGHNDVQFTLPISGKYLTKARFVSSWTYSKKSNLVTSIVVTFGQTKDKDLVKM